MPDGSAVRGISAGEVLFLVVAATIADCEDYEEIAEFGRNRLPFLRKFSEFYFGTPCADWLRVVMNRIGPDLFQEVFTDWATALRLDAPKLIAIDGKTSRRTHNRSRGQRALHMVSAWATSERLVLAQEAVDEKANECTAIPEVLDRLDLKGAVVTIDAIACNPTIAEAITTRGGDYLLAVKANQPTLHREIAACVADPAVRAQTVEEVDKGHGRLEIRRYAVSHETDWLSGDRRYAGEPRFPGLRSIARVEAQVERNGETTRATRYYPDLPDEEVVTTVLGVEVTAGQIRVAFRAVSN